MLNYCYSQMGDFLQILTKVGTTLQDILIVLWILCISAQNDKVSGSTRRGRPWAMEFSLGQGLLFMDVCKPGAKAPSKRTALQKVW